MLNSVDNSRNRGIELPSHIICFSPVRWDRNLQRPQQVMTRLAGQCTIHFIEEPVYDATNDGPYLSHNVKSEHIHITVPHLPAGISEEKSNKLLRGLLDRFMRGWNFTDYAFWYMTPLAFSYSNHYRPTLTVYDCIEDIAAFKYPAEKLNMLEQELLNRADIVFTSSHGQYWDKKDKHDNIHLLPGSVDRAHFDRARGKVSEAEDQEAIPFPRLGYMGMVDSRLDLNLLEEIADQKPDWHIVLVGPTSGMSTTPLPQRPNIHYLGNKPYAELPSYLTGWTAAIMPLTDSRSIQAGTSFKAAECMAAGLPVIATPIKAITEQYGKQKLVLTATNATEFVKATEAILFDGAADRGWLQRVNDFLEISSWDHVVSEMTDKLKETVQHSTYEMQVA